MRFSRTILTVLAGIFISAWLGQTTVHADVSTGISPPMNQMMGDGGYWSGEKSPGLAALLSLQPMPLDFGNFYVGNWKKGILYTSLELGIFIPGMALLGNHGMWNWSGSDSRSSWTDSERVTFYSLLVGYVAVKVVSAFDAGSTAERMARGENISLNLKPRERQVIMSARMSF